MFRATSTLSQPLAADLLATAEASDFAFTERYSYKNRICSYAYPAEKSDTLRGRFFSPMLDGGESLSAQVQSEFDLLLPGINN